MAKAKKTAQPEQPQLPYEPTIREAAALESFKQRRNNRKPSAEITVGAVAKGSNEISIKHEDILTGYQLLMESIGTADYDFMNGLLKQIVVVGTQGTASSARDINFMLSMVRGIEPRDQLETMLAAQMAAVHNATMTFAQRLAHVKTIPQQDSAERALNKLARTFTTQIEALKRYRSTGEQKMTVQHVTVNDGGQAIVGDVMAGAGTNKKEELPHAKQITDAPGETLSCPLEAEREAVPSPSR